MSQSPDAPPPPEGKPKFLDPLAAAADSYEHNPEDEKAQLELAEASQNYEPTIGKPLHPRHRVVCQLLSAGKSTKFIMKQTGLSQQGIYKLMKSPAIIKEVSRLQDKIFEEDVVTRMKDLGPDAVNVIEEILRDPSLSALKKGDKATWVIEKLTGKAKQEHSIESNSITAFMEVMKQMQQSGERLPDIDVTPQQISDESETPEKPTRAALPAPKSSNKFTKFVDEEL